MQTKKFNEVMHPMPSEPKRKPISVVETDDILRVIAKAALEKQAAQIRILDLKKIVSYTDAVVILSGQNDRQVRAIVENVEEQLRVVLGLKPTSIEGQTTAAWVCMDYGDVIVHIFYAPARDYYDLDNLWTDGNDRSEELLQDLEEAAE
jgi:ribosome-associated protein